MILEIDAGNSFLKWRCTTSDGGVSSGRETYTSLLQRRPDAWSTTFDLVRIASVAGEAVESSLRQWLQPLTVSPLYFAHTSAVCAGVTNSYADPSRMGVDRWLAMLAAFNECRGACCIVDCGSAVTVDYLSAQGQHLGGYILPGIRLMTESLLKDTAGVRFAEQEMTAHLTTPGTDTASAVGHGVNFLFAALQEKVLSELSAEMTLFITGGDGLLFRQLANHGELREHLVLDGLRWCQA
ncbi:type III pantothenate kinase [Pontibacter sp. JAM-7]|uniref:type III pantothenate kinase n=1 Tax=Pontibacter sp. JAM-7 TaxID=3366581 RepID=UPI003AF7030D